MKKKTIRFKSQWCHNLNCHIGNPDITIAIQYKPTIEPAIALEIWDIALWFHSYVNVNFHFFFFRVVLIVDYFHWTNVGWPFFVGTNTEALLTMQLNTPVGSERGSKSQLKWMKQNSKYNKKQIVRVEWRKKINNQENRRKL